MEDREKDFVDLVGEEGLLDEEDLLGRPLALRSFSRGSLTLSGFFCLLSTAGSAECFVVSTSSWDFFDFDLKRFI